MLKQSYIYRFLVAFLVLFQWQGVGQDTVYLSDLVEQRTVLLNLNGEAFESERSLSIEQYLALENTEHNFDESQGDKVYWYEVYVENDLPDTLYFFFWSSNSLEYNHLYEVEQGELRADYQNGFLMPKSLMLTEYPEAIPLVIPLGESRHYIGRFSNKTNYPPYLAAELVTYDTFIWYGYNRHKEQAYIVGFGLIFQGAVWIMMLYMLFLYFQNNRDRVYLSYAAYLFFSMLYLALKLSKQGSFDFFLSDLPYFKYVLNEPLQFAIAIFYNVFALHFLKIKQQNKLIYRLVFWLNVVYATYALIIAFYLYFSGDILTVRLLFAPTRLLMLVSGLLLIIIVAIKLKGPIMRYFVAGSTFFFLGNMLAILISIAYRSNLDLPNLRLGAINFTQLGIFAEILFFSLGIGKLIQISNREKEEIKDAYIRQLVENQKLGKKLNRELEVKVEKRTKEVLKANRELQESKARQLKSEYERQLMESEMNSLRLQMNPHFIFNSLNSIRYFILKQDVDKATDYITSFAKLLRMILDHSKRTEVSLADELEALELYMMFEAERFNEKFGRKISLASDIDAEHVFIQPLIIQPFVENAIWHGLMHKKEAGTVSIDISKGDKNLLRIIIEDDGVGREMARSLKSKDSGRHKSHGLNITRERLEAMNKISQGKAGFEMEDLFHEDGSVAGTRIILSVNIKQHESTNN